MVWNPLDESIDYAIISGRRSPGVCVIENAGSPRDWEERRPYAFAGATLWYKGLKLSHFTIKLYLYTTIHWEEWQFFKTVVAKPPVRTRAKAMKVQHPILADLGIGEMVVEDQKQPVETEPNVWMVEIQCIEYRAIKFALAKPDAAQVKPEDPVDRLINNLTNQVNTLANPPPPLPKRAGGPPPLPAGPTAQPPGDFIPPLPGLV